MQADLRAATEFIQGRLYLLSSRSVATLLNHGQASDIHYLTVDDKHVYEPFYRDFGPVHLGHTIAFCRLLRKTLNVRVSTQQQLSETNTRGETGTRPTKQEDCCCNVI